MSARVLVVAAPAVAERLAGALPEGSAPFVIDPDAVGDPLAGLGDALASAQAAVVCLDGLPGRLLPRLEDALRRFGGRSAVVRGRPWNGSAPLPLARSCTAVVAGFGDAAATAAAVARLWAESPSAGDP